jgi:hypothetical protein
MLDNFDFATVMLHHKKVSILYATIRVISIVQILKIIDLTCLAGTSINN